jgi:hypothetical protein
VCFDSNTCFTDQQFSIFACQVWREFSSQKVSGFEEYFLKNWWLSQFLNLLVDVTAHPQITQAAHCDCLTKSGLGREVEKGLRTCVRPALAMGLRWIQRFLFAHAANCPHGGEVGADADELRLQRLQSVCWFFFVGVSFLSHRIT